MRRISNSVFVKLAAILFAAFCIFTIIRLQFKNNDIKSDIADLSAEYEAAEDNYEELKRQLDEPLDDQYVRDVARDKLGLRLPEEIVVYSDK